MTAVIGSLPMRQVLSTVQKIAKSNAAVLVTGETGSGKEVVARAIHH
jgi:DNA-binding NtrC family response regulator